MNGKKEDKRWRAGVVECEPVTVNEVDQYMKELWEDHLRITQERHKRFEAFLSHIANVYGLDILE
jgi:hypothetical protein